MADGHRLLTHKKMGLVADVFDEDDHPRADRQLRHRPRALQHLRLQPHPQRPAPAGGLPPRHREPGPQRQPGQRPRAAAARWSCDGSIFATTSDTEVILHLLARNRADTCEDALLEILPRVKGAYSLVVLTRDRLIAVRDPYGFRPLCLGRYQDSYVVASESCAFDIIGAEYLRDIEPGEMVVLGEGELASRRLAGRGAREALRLRARLLLAAGQHGLRRATSKRSGAAAARSWAARLPADADLVCAVPDSSNTAALGYARATGLPFELALIRNHYVGRTFISPAQKVRDMSVRIKFNPVAEVLAGKRVVVVDDSIVRGTTMRKLVKLIRGAGREEVHLRIASPPVTNPCLLRDRHAGAQRADRLEPHRGGDRHLSAGRFPRLPVPGGPAGSGRRRGQVLRGLFHRQLPGLLRRGGRQGRVRQARRRRRDSRSNRCRR